MEKELAGKIVTSLKKAGVSFITFVPETRLSQILPYIQEDNFFQLVPVASEAEAVEASPTRSWPADPRRALADRSVDPVRGKSSVCRSRPRRRHQPKITSR